MPYVSMYYKGRNNILDKINLIAYRCEAEHCVTSHGS